MFRKRREKELAALAQAVAAAVVQALGERPKTDLAAAGEFGGQMLDGMSKFLAGAGDIALRGAASQLGQRGGKRTAQRKRQMREAQEAAQRRPVCKLCRDPMARPLTVQEINLHREHENNVFASPESANETGNIGNAGEIPRNEYGLYAKQRIVGNTDDSPKNGGGNSNGLPN
jgi:hypothetical protein